MGEYKFDEHIQRRLLAQIRKPKNKLERISFSYFGFRDEAPSHSLDHIDLSQSLASYQAAVYGNNGLIAPQTSESISVFYDDEVFDKDNDFRIKLTELNW